MADQSVVLPNDGSRPGTPWWIRGTGFAEVEAPQTYDLDVVLRLREALAAAVESWQPVAPVIAEAALTPSEGRGCDARAVDQWLDMVRAAMNEGMAAPAVPHPVVAAPAAQPVTAPPTAAQPEQAAAPAGEVKHADVAQRINDVRFTPLRFRHGYVMTEVDDFLDELVAAVTAGEPVAHRVQEVRFTESRMREAYLIEDVEAFLAQLVRDHEGVTITRSRPTD